MESSFSELMFLSLEEVLSLRSKILRPHLPIEKSIYPEDNDPLTFHLGIKNLENELVCVGTFIQQKPSERYSDSKYSGDRSYRLRGMATSEAYQGQGLGSQVLLGAQKVLLERQCDLLWFNARLKAVPFYKKLNFLEVPGVFEVPDIGPHILMYKILVGPNI